MIITNKILTLKMLYLNDFYIIDNNLMILFKFFLYILYKIIQKKIFFN